MDYKTLLTQLGLDNIDIEVTLKVPVRKGEWYKKGKVMGIKPGKRGGGHYNYEKNPMGGERIPRSFDSTRIHWITPIRVAVAYDICTFGKSQHVDWVDIDNCDFEIKTNDTISKADYNYDVPNPLESDPTKEMMSTMEQLTIIESYAVDYVDTFWFEQPYDIQRKMQIAYKAGFLKSMDVGILPTPSVQPTIGHILTGEMMLQELNPDVVEKELDFPKGILRKLMNDEYYTNSVPVVLFKNLLVSLHIPFSVIEPAMLPTFKLLKSKETSETLKKKPQGYELWENEISLGKYTRMLKELMLPTPMSETWVVNSSI